MTREQALAELERAQTALEAVRAFLAQDTGQPAEAAPAPPVSPQRGLSNPAAFFAHLRTTKVLGNTLEQGEVDGCKAIVSACEGWPVSWAAYALATAVVETAGTMQPVREAYWLSVEGQRAWARKMYDIEGARPDKARELGNTTPGDGFKYAGRGYVQITGKTNFAKAEAATGLPLVAQPDKAMELGPAAAIMRWGMEEGAFTGKSLNDYLPAVATREQFKNARRVINGQDRAGEIADFALHFQAALQAGGWQ